MGQNSSIEWTDATVNFWWGCTKVASPSKQSGCKFCYAETLANRWGKDIWGPKPRLIIPSAPKLMLRLQRQAVKERRRIKVFVQSMSDFFEDHDGPIIDWKGNRILNLTLTNLRTTAFETFDQCPDLDIQLLTKRPENIERMWREKNRSGFLDDNRPNVWLGTSVEDQAAADLRIPLLLKAAHLCRFTFLSCEPLLGPVSISPYLPNNPLHEDQAQRGVRLSGSSEWGPGDTSGRNDMEDSEKGMGPMAAQGDKPTVQASSRRAFNREVFPNTDNDGRSADIRFGTSSGVPSLQGPDSGPSHNQPYRRNKDQEPSGQSGASHDIGTAASRESCSQDGTVCQPTRGEEPQGQVDQRRGGVDTGGIRDGDSNASRNSEAVQSAPSDDIQNSERGRTPVAEGTDKRLCIPEGSRQCEQGQVRTISLCIVGGESGHSARPFNIDWARSIIRECKEAGVACFVKQLGAHPFDGPTPLKLKDGHGGDWDEWPEDIRVREFPLQPEPFPQDLFT